MERRPTRKIGIGKQFIGGNAPVTVQSMTTCAPRDLEESVRQIQRLEAAGCQIVRVSVPDQESARKLADLKSKVSIPIVADIHFDYRLALQSIDAGADKVRINPGNIGSKQRMAEVLNAAKAAGIPIRIGVNSGSLEKDLLMKYGHPTAAAMLDSVERHLRICLDHDFHDVIVALKSSDVSLMIEANRMFSEKYDFPLHLGVTEAGPSGPGTIRSAIGIGTLLAEGIGDTLRVSLTADPVEEVHAGIEILRSLGLYPPGVKIISCPTCGRIQVDIIPIVRELHKRTRSISKNITVAVMGCAVNGPGEAREADFGVACGKHEALLFERGQAIGKIKESEILDTLLQKIDAWNEDSI